MGRLLGTWRRRIGSFGMMKRLELGIVRALYIRVAVPMRSGLRCGIGLRRIVKGLPGARPAKTL